MSSHPGIKQIEFLVRGKLDEQETQAVRLHLESCEQCRALYEDCQANEPVAINLRKASEEQPTVRLGETASFPGGETHAPGSPAIPGYRIVRELHRGGQGVVYEAFQESPPRRVALKVMLGGPFAGQASRRRFEREVELAGNLKHPNIVAIHHSGVATGNYWFAMDYVDGQRLNAYLAGHNLSIEDRLRLFGKICDAVEYAHRRQVIHRDLKPSNILVDEQGEPRILDFGLARQVEPDERLDISLDGHVLGTLPYMSPEQARGDLQAIDTRTDVYSLGVVLYEMLTGKYPYDVAGSMRDVLDRIINTEPTPPSRVGRPEMASSLHSFVGRLRSISPLRRRSSSGIDSSVERIILRSLAKNPERRYPSVTDLAADVARYLSGEPVVGPEDPWWLELWQSVVRHRVPVGIASGFLVLLLGFGITASILAKRNKELADRESAARQKADWNAYVANITAADAALRTNDGGAVRTRLDACPQKLRGWEWQYLNATADTSIVTLRGRAWGVTSAAFSPDGKQIITASSDNTATLWDSTTGESLATFCGHTSHVCSAAFSPDGKRIVTASGDHTAKLWDSSTRRELATLRGHEDSVYFAVFSPDGTRIATASQDGTARVWDVATRSHLTTFRGHTRLLHSVAFSPDGKWIATGSADNTAKLWNVATEQEVKTLHGHAGMVLCVAFSPDGRQIATASYDKTVKVWDTAMATEPLTLRGHSQWVGGVAFSADGKYITTGSGDSTVKLWCAATGQELATLRGHTSGVGPRGSVAFSPDGQRVVAASYGAITKVWDMVAVLAPLGLRVQTRYAWSGAFSPDGIQIVTASGDRAAKLWDAITGQELAELRGHKDHVRCAVFSPDGKRVVTASDDRTAKIWDADTGRVLASLNGHEGLIESVVVSPDGKWIVTSSHDNTAKIWSAETLGELFTLVGHGSELHGAAFSPDGKRIVTAPESGHPNLWDAITGRDLGFLRMSVQFISGAAFGPDGTQIVTSNRGRTSVWDVDTQRELVELKGHMGVVYSAGFSPSGTRIVTASLDGTARVWDAVTGQQLISLYGQDPLHSAVFSPDGERIMTTPEEEGMATIWDSVPYAQRYRQRQAALSAEEKAKPIVEDLHTRLGDWAKVAEAIRNDQSVDEVFRCQAVNLVLQSSSAELNAKTATRTSSRSAQGPTATAPRAGGY